MPDDMDGPRKPFDSRTVEAAKAPERGYKLGDAGDPYLMPDQA